MKKGNLKNKTMVLRRTINAPPQKVFRAFTDAKQLIKWWGPDDFENSECEVNLKVGGKIRIVMRGALGLNMPEQDFPMEGVFKEIKPSRRISFMSYAFFPGSDEPKIDALQTIDFEKEGKNTKLALRADVRRVDPSAKMAVAGMEAGWSQSLEKLDMLVGNYSDRHMTFKRVLDAPVSRVWKAFVDPKQVVKWWGPNGFTNTIKKMDVQKGGEWRMVMHGPDGADYLNHSTFYEVTENQRIAYIHTPEDEKSPSHFIWMLTFAPFMGKTMLSMRLVFKYPALKDMSIKKYNALEGGNQTLDRLEKFLKK